jgi:UDP:flavonoid glycosyltransferase YjiC (YdhE family)
MRILFTPWGSFGDLHPYLAVALEVKRRGHDVLIATSEVYRQKVEGEGLRFHGVRPDMSRFLENPELMKSVMHARRGPEYIVREIMMPALRDSFEDILAVAADADLLISHAAMYGTPLVAEVLQQRWLSVALQPAVFFSTLDPPYFPLVGSVTRMSPSLARLVFSLINGLTRRWVAPWHSFRTELKLPASSKSPITQGQFSPFGTLALFSPAFAAPQPDWPPHTVATGFAFYDKLDASSAGLPADLAEFLNTGDPPVVFTLGSSAVFDPGRFYDVSAEAANRLGIRAVLLAGPEFRKRITIQPNNTLHIAEYAPYSALFPRAAAIVHPGGVGTTAQALRAGKPMLVMPYSHDQPDNAARIKRLGAGLSIGRNQYTISRVSNLLRQLLQSASIAAHAKGIAQQISLEDGAGAAADVIEQHLHAT